MRDAYTRCVQKRKALTRSGSKASRLPSCNFYSQLAFLSHASECSTPTIIDTNITLDDNTSNDSSNQNDVNELPSQQSVKSLRKGSVYRDHKKTKINDEIDQQFLAELKNCNENLAKNDEPEDSDALFCKSLVKQMAELTPEQNMLVRIKMQQSLFEIKFGKKL